MLARTFETATSKSPAIPHLVFGCVVIAHRRKILRAISNLGDGTVFRVIREIRKRYFQPLEIAPS